MVLRPRWALGAGEGFRFGFRSLSVWSEHINTDHLLSFNTHSCKIQSSGPGEDPGESFNLLNECLQA